jgi:hypothetical protein
LGHFFVDHNLLQHEIDTMVIPAQCLLNPITIQHDEPIDFVNRYINNIQPIDRAINNYVYTPVIYIYFTTRSSNNNPYLILGWTDNIIQILTLIDIDGKQFGSKNKGIQSQHRLLFIKNAPHNIFSNIVNKIETNQAELLYQVVDISSQIIYRFDDVIMKYFHQ